MLEVVPNPYSDPIKKFISDIKATKWAFPFIPQLLHLIISIVFLLLLSILYVTIGLISQISNSFWDLIVGLCDKMSFSSPITSSFYAFSVTIYFILFLPFFIIQSPMWLGGWIASKIGFKPFIASIILLLLSAYIYFYQPEFASETADKMITFKKSFMNEYFPSDSLYSNEAKITEGVEIESQKNN